MAGAKLVHVLATAMEVPEMSENASPETRHTLEVLSVLNAELTAGSVALVEKVQDALCRLDEMGTRDCSPARS